MEYYSDKKRSLPRFIYRNLMAELGEANADRSRIIGKFVEFVQNLQFKGDWLKLKWCLPPRLANALIVMEGQPLVEALRARGTRRNERLIEVFPHCSDEFSMDIEFLDAAFGAQQLALVSPATEVFTIGSCFAVNIANFLKDKGFNVTPFAQAEDLNSPFSNAKMLSVCAASPGFQRAYVEHWVGLLYPEEYRGRLAEIVEGELLRLEELARHITDSEVIIVTCGNILDYFLPSRGLPDEPGPAVSPKFFSISASEDIELRQYLTNKMKSAGAEFRLGTFQESVAALMSQHEAIRNLNSEAHLLYTLSPVPIDSAIGIKTARRIGAIELDCVSKSMLRVALAEVFARLDSDQNLHYFPSFEMVRWVAPCIEGVIFGNEDAASRHVSQRVLDGVYRYFMHKYCYMPHKAI